MIGGPASGVCHNSDLDIVVQSSGGLAMSWQGVNWLICIFFPNVRVMTNLATNLVGDARKCGTM